MKRQIFTHRTFVPNVPYTTWQVTKYALLIAVLYLLGRIYQWETLLSGVLLGLCLLRLLFVVNTAPSWSVRRKVEYSLSIAGLAVLVGFRLFGDSLWERWKPYATWIVLGIVVGGFVLWVLYCTMQIRRNTSDNIPARNKYIQIEELAYIALLYCIILL